jgi:hypothetical protein
MGQLGWVKSEGIAMEVGIMNGLSFFKTSPHAWVGNKTPW